MRAQRNHRRRKPAVLLQVLLVCGVIAGVFFLQAGRAGRSHPATPHAPAAPASSTPSGQAEVEQAPAFDRTAHSTTDPVSPWVIVNKTHPIDPLDFRPEIAIVRGYQVAVPAAGALTRLLDDGDGQGLSLKIASAFRSYDYQRHVHDGLVASEGATAADDISARPGYSEHQTGLAVDLVTLSGSGCDLDQCFAQTPAGRWLAANAWRYGFIVRYQRATTAITGYAPEPWHLRFVGRALAAELHGTGVATLEQFFDVPGGDYPGR